MPSRKRRRRLTWAALAIALAVTLLLVDWRFMARAITYPEEAAIMSIDWYRPKALVKGKPGAPFSASTAQPPPRFAEALQQIATYAEERNSTELIVMHRGSIVLEKYWRDYDPASQFNAMSMSKTIVGLLVGTAIAEGAIGSLDDPAAQYLPEWRKDERAAITLRDLLYMQSGLRNERNTSSPFSDLVRMYIGSNVESVALDVPSVATPGQTFDYNNVNSQVLAIILERATGMSYSDYLSSRLWQPIGASDASVWLDRPRGMPKTFCCLFATARDWARIGQMLLDEGRVGQRQVVPAEWIRQMLIPSPLESTFGLHIWVAARTPDYPNVDQAASTPFLASDTFHLDGRGLQRVYIVPSEELVIVRAGETPNTWDDSKIPNRLVEALRSP